MSRCAPPDGSVVLATPRRSMTDARKRRIHERANGLCEEPTCARPLPVTGPQSQYDHIVPVWLGGADTDDQCQLLCFECHAIKTARDIAAIAKAKRILAREDGTRRERKAIPNRGFGTKLRKRMNGKVEIRT